MARDVRFWSVSADHFTTTHEGRADRWTGSIVRSERLPDFRKLGRAIVAMSTPLGGFAEKAEVGLEVGISIKLGICLCPLRLH